MARALYPLASRIVTLMDASGGYFMLAQRMEEPPEPAAPKTMTEGQQYRKRAELAREVFQTGR